MKKERPAKSTMWLPRIFSHNMVLQSGKPTPVWGQGRAGEKIRIQIAGKTFTGIADKKGNFKIHVGPLEPGGPHTLIVGGTKTIELKNVLVGDVWVCSGQSNMEMALEESTNGKSEVAQANFEGIRVFNIPRSVSNKPWDDTVGSWQVCKPENMKRFSATAYFFGREIHTNTGMPIGLINTSYGGTRIEPWISMEGFKTWDKYEQVMKTCKNALKNMKSVPQSQISPAPFELHKDTGNKGFEQGWASPTVLSPGWKKIKTPGYWNNQGLNIVGAVWLRKSVTVPRAWLGFDLYCSLGPIVDFDTTYVNGEKIGSIGMDTPDFWTVPRTYLVPARLVRPGKNVIAVRVFAHNTVGGFGGLAEAMSLSVVNRRELGDIPLHGTWEYRVEQPRKPVSVVVNSWLPTTLYNAMVNPIAGFGLTGFLWYQGESNAENPFEYRSLFRILIRDWRKKWGAGNVPFYFVQLPNYKSPGQLARWPELREAQSMALAEPNTGMAVTIDIGDPNDLHSKNKQDFGRRLARIALNKVYGKPVSCSGPRYASMKVGGNRMRIVFDHAQRGLKTVDNKQAAGFEISGSNKVFWPARAAVRKNIVTVWNAFVKKPVAVRYAWRKAPQCNLCNTSLLPAAPFRTDSWNEITPEEK